MIACILAKIAHCPNWSHQQQVGANQNCRQKQVSQSATSSWQLYFKLQQAIAQKTVDQNNDILNRCPRDLVTMLHYLFYMWGNIFQLISKPWNILTVWRDVCTTPRPSNHIYMYYLLPISGNMFKYMSSTYWNVWPFEQMCARPSNYVLPLTWSNTLQFIFSIYCNIVTFRPDVRTT